MQIQFIGAAQTVTGSMHVVRTSRATILLDCGLYQGRRREAYERNTHAPWPVRDVSAVVLSHAHIDHAGAVPLLASRGYEGPIYATAATRDLCAVMLRDAANIQASDARFLNRQNERDGCAHEVLAPLYDEEDVLAAIERFRGVPYRRSIPIASGVRLTFLDAGHVLGSAITVLDIDEAGGTKRLVFTGDLGRAGRPILRDPEVPEGAHVLITESTYGDRLHGSLETLEDDLAAVVERTIARGGKILIPSFALERAQEVVLALKNLQRRGRLPRVPVYVDSPLTVRITDVFKLHPECYDAEARAMLKGHDSPFELDDLRYVEDVEDSKRVTTSPEPAIVIAASGMCEGGRILHHLRGAIEDERNTILIVGFQAPHTLGRRLVERRSRVRIFGIERERRADVVVLNGFSAHADQGDLVAFANAVKARGHLGTVALVHGERRAQDALAGLLAAHGHERVAIPAPGETLDA